MKNHSYLLTLMIALLTPSFSSTMNNKINHKEGTHESENHSLKNSIGPSNIIVRKVEMVESLAKSAFFGFCAMVSGYKGACLLIDNAEGYLSQNETMYMADINKKTALKKITLGGCVIGISYYLASVAMKEARRAEELSEKKTSC